MSMMEEDLLMLFEAWHRLCDPHMPFHIRNKSEDVPVGKVEEFQHGFAVPSCPSGAIHGSPSDSSTSAEEIAAPEHMWLANLLNAFGTKGGFDMVCKVRGPSVTIAHAGRSLPLLSRHGHALASCSCTTYMLAR